MLLAPNSMWKIIAGRQLEVAEAEELLREKKVGPLQNFKSKMGRPFAAIIKMGAEFKPEFDFGQGTGEDGQAQEVDFSGQEPLGKCPKCQSNVYDNGMAYVCEKAVGPNKTCDFRSGKVILQREMKREEVAKLLATGKTDLLHKFISKRNKPFSAYLVLGKEGKTSFEFEPRPVKGAKKGSPKKGAVKPEAERQASQGEEKGEEAGQ